jgi:hypothetical protein
VRKRRPHQSSSRVEEEKISAGNLRLSPTRRTLIEFDGSKKPDGLPKNFVLLLSQV